MLAWLSSITTSTSRAGFHFRENVEIILSKFIDIVSLKKMLPVKLVSFQRRPKIYSAIFYFVLVRSVRFDLMGLNHSGFFKHRSAWNGWKLSLPLTWVRISAKLRGKKKAPNFSTAEIGKVAVWKSLTLGLLGLYLLPRLILCLRGPKTEQAPQLYFILATIDCQQANNGKKQIVWTIK